MGKKGLILIAFILFSLAGYSQGSKKYSIYQRGLEVADSTFKMRDTLGGNDSLTMHIRNGDAHIGGSIDSLIFDVPVNISGGSGSAPTGPNYSLQFRDGSGLHGSDKFIVDTVNSVMTVNSKLEVSGVGDGCYLETGTTETGLYSQLGDEKMAVFDDDQYTYANGAINYYTTGDSIKLPPLAGSGVRMVTTTATGKLGAAAIPTYYYELASVAAAQDSATNNNFVSGTFYKIPNIGGFTGSFIILQATTDSTLATTGYGKFINGAMTNYVDAEMGYDLAGDVVQMVYEPSRKNRIVQSTNVATAAITEFPFDDANLQWNNLINVTITNFSVADPYGQFFSYNNISNSTISLENGSEISNCEIENSTVSIGATSATFIVGSKIYTATITAADGYGITNSNFEQGSSTVIVSNQSLENCIVGKGKTLDLTNIQSGYTASGRYYTAEGSNFRVVQSDNAAVVIDGSHDLDMTQFQFAGEVVLGNTSAGDTLRTWSGLAADGHIVKVLFGDTGTYKVQEGYGIDLPSGAGSIISFTQKDYFILELDGFSGDPVVTRYAQY